MGFFSSHQNAGRVFYSQIKQVSLIKTCFTFFAKFCFQISCFFILFSFLPLKTLQIQISTSVSGAQHTNADQNIQQHHVYDEINI